MKVLVTGATGFIGAAVVRALAAAGVEVRALVRPNSDLRNLDDHKVELFHGHLHDQDSLRRALAGCRQLYHVAAHYALWANDPSIFYDVNVAGSLNALTTAQELGIERMVYTSSVSAVGIPHGGGLGTEQTPVWLDQMIGHYKRSKYLAEQKVMNLAQAGLPVVIVNPSAPVGEGDIKPTPTGQMVVDYMKGRMWGYVETGLNLIDVDDVAMGHLLAMDKGRVGERYILANRNMSLLEIFEILGGLTGIKAPRLKLPQRMILGLAYLDHWLAAYLTHRPPRIPLDGVRMAKYRMHYDSSKAIRELGLPQTPIETALKKAVTWFRAHGYA
ncbi:hopanoid-associated sugar epimerase [Nitrospira sp. Nam74]